MILWESLSFA
ncbi:hypothetical protein LINPERHAP2_LOCUS21399 [Linum perenne]